MITDPSPAFLDTLAFTLIGRGIQGNQKRRDKPITRPSSRNKPGNPPGQKEALEKKFVYLSQSPCVRERFIPGFLFREEGPDVVIGQVEYGQDPRSHDEPPPPLTSTGFRLISQFPFYNRLLAGFSYSFLGWLNYLDSGLFNSFTGSHVL